MRLISVIVFVVGISLGLGQAEIILQPSTAFCNENAIVRPKRIESSENITSPNYPEAYDPSMDCYMQRYTNHTHLKIQFFRVAMEANYDFLEIYNGLHSAEEIESSQLSPAYTFATQEEKGQGITMGNEVTLHLTSDTDMENEGLAMQISSYDVDECADPSKHNCDVHAHCHDVIGGFQCECVDGFTGDGTVCEDIDECASNNHTCSENSVCTNKPGTYTCICKHGYERNGSDCIDVDECAENSKICSVRAVCNNLEGTYECVCSTGYYGDGRVCQDIDECSSKDRNQCSVDAVCSNTIGSYDCTCKAGHKGDGRTCVEKLECSTGEHTCSQFAYCTETHGGYNCTCHSGYEGDGYICKDIDECNKHAHNCSSNALCTNTQGGFTCQCRDGFIGDGYSCTDINECADARTTCAENGWCRNYPGGYSCECNDGYGGDAYTNCTDVNECVISPGICSAHGDCHNTIGSYQCTCHTGFSGPPCTDINECKGHTHNCSEQAFCVNTKGSYKCNCKKGYAGNGITCDDVDECQTNRHRCNVNADCINTPGKYRCECKPGFIGKGFKCADVDECRKNLDDCSAQAFCANTVGSYTCKCIKGYQGDGRVCEDVNECEGSHRCDENAICTNTPGKYKCKCKEGYIGKGYVGKGNSKGCIDVDECRKQPKVTASCSPHGSCTNLPGNWTCTCDPGFENVARHCLDVNECRTGSANCSPEATCNNEIGGYNCVCNDGFVGNGTVCTDVNECLEQSQHSLCGSNSYCVNTRGGYDCKCSEGFKSSNNVCEDIDECALNTDDCSQNARCINTIGNFTCECLNGYRGDGRQCDDIDECAQAHAVCGANSKCGNLIGSYQCTCTAGFNRSTTNGPCTDIDECSVTGIAAPCSPDATCTNSIGSFGCRCNQGYLGDGHTCADVDECAMKTDNCNEHATCINNNGSYTCRCNEGFVGNGQTCNDFDECTHGTHRCSRHAECMNLHGSHRCSCLRGFTGNGTHCQDIDECTAAAGGSDMTSSVCGAHAACVNSPGEYECRCLAGFVMASDSTCVDVDECATIGCHAHANCTNTPGSYICRCREGYTGNGVNCTDINECENGEAKCGENTNCVNTPANYMCTCKTGYEDGGAGHCDAYCNPLRHHNFTFEKTKKESFAQSKEKCNFNGDSISMAKIYCDYSPLNEDGSSPGAIASFDMSTMIQATCDEVYPEKVDDKMMRKEIETIEVSKHFDEIHHKVKKVEHYITRLDLHGEKDTFEEFDRFYVKVVEPPKDTTKKTMVIHTERRLNTDLDIIDVVLPLNEINRTKRAGVIVYKNPQSFFDESSLDSRIVTIVAERGKMFRGDGLKMLNNPISVKYDTHFKSGYATALHGTKKKLMCYRWNEEEVKFVSDNCCLDDREKGKPVCNCNVMSDYAIVLTNEDERVKPTHATSVLVAYVIGMTGYAIAFFLLVCNRRVRGMRETYRYLCFSLAVITFNGILLFSDVSTYMAKYCHVMSVALHFFALLGWFWLASIVKSAFDHNDKISEPIKGKCSIFFSLLYHLLAAGLVVGITVGLTFGHFDKALPQSSQLSHRCEAKLSDSYYYSHLTCWLHGYAFLGGFIFFVGIIAIFILAICFLVAKTTSKIARHSVQYEILQQNRYHLFALGLFTIVHSLSWVALLALWKTVDKNFNFVFQWVFVVVNSIQGFHFCYVTCYQRKLVRKALFGCAGRITNKNDISNDVSSDDRSSYNYTSTV